MEQYTEQSYQIFEPELVYGGFWERVGAYLIDAIILGAVSYFVGLLVGSNMFARHDYSYYSDTYVGYSYFTGARLRGSLLSIIINWLYFALQESGAAQATIGKRALGLKVVGREGRRISFLNATGRYFGKFVSAVILGIGFLMVAWDDRKQGLHDKMADTFVIKDLNR